MTAIELRGVTAGYHGVPVVRDLNLRVEEGEVVALLGANGAGKTTTLKTIAGVLPTLGGEIVVLDEPVTRTSPHRLARRGFALVPENRGIFRQLTVGENLRLGRRTRRGSNAEIVSYFPALQQLMKRRCGLLSGGEQQMLAVAKAFVSDPRVLVIDELSLGLAPVVVQRLLATVRRVATEQSMALLVVEQHVGLALQIADRAHVLRHGRLAAEGTAVDLLSRPEVLESSYLG